MSTWQPTPRGLALAAHIRNQFHETPCPDDCPICPHPRVTPKSVVMPNALPTS